MSTKIIVDSREPEKIKYSLKVLRIPHAIKKLPLGDYAIKEADLLKCVIERKTVDDLLNSVRQRQARKTKVTYHRFTSQVTAHCLSNVGLQGIGIVGDVEKEDENVFYGTLASACVRAFDFMYWVPDDQKFLKFTYSFLKKVGEEKWQMPPKSKKKRYNAIMVLLELGLSEKKAVDLIQEFGSLRGVAKAKMDDLEWAVGKRIAKKVYEFFGSTE